MTEVILESWSRYNHPDNLRRRWNRGLTDRFPTPKILLLCPQTTLVGHPPLEPATTEPKSNTDSSSSESLKSGIFDWQPHTNHVDNTYHNMSEYFQQFFKYIVDLKKRTLKLPDSLNHQYIHRTPLECTLTTREGRSERALGYRCGPCGRGSLISFLCCGRGRKWKDGVLGGRLMKKPGM
ncbi:3-glucanase [Striga asiatica]|uniref:3-glucanase n=1 Tax=Striga asiatica TaxID=4170 RepID=A0A5A7PVZ0_STRAF|nr:3-glucanase [Striga asiatica]